MIIIASLILVLITPYVASKPLQVINKDGLCLSSDKISRFLLDQVPNTARIDTVGVIDCTAYSDCSFVNHIFQSNFDAGESGLQLDTTGSTAVAYATFDKVFSASFCGSKAVDYQCALHSSALKATTCVAVKSFDFETTLKSFDQIYRRFLKYAFTRTSNGCDDPMNIVLLLDASGVSSLKETDSTNCQLQIEKYLESIWMESFGEISFEVAVKVRVVSVKADEPQLLRQAQDSLAEIIMKNSVVRMKSADMVTEAVDDLSVSEGVQHTDGTTAEELAQVLYKAWIRLPKDPIPVLSQSERNTLFLVETAHTACMEQAETAIRQWQARTSKGRRIVGFPFRVGQLLTAIERDFVQRVATSTAPLVRDRGERLQGLKNYVLNAAGKLYAQQLVIVEFKVLNNFRHDLARLIAQNLSEENRREQEQATLRKALFIYRTQAAEMDDVELGFALTEARVTELSTTLETVLREFPESAMAKLQEVRKLERQARSGKRAQVATGIGRKRKGIAKALGVSLSLVGMLRPPGYGNLQGFIGYAASILGLPLDILLGVQNDGDSPEVMGEDREYPILRLQPKIKFDIDLQ